MMESGKKKAKADSYRPLGDRGRIPRLNMCVCLEMNIRIITCMASYFMLFLSPPEGGACCPALTSFCRWRMSSGLNSEVVRLLCTREFRKVLHMSRKKAHSKQSL